MEPDQQQPDYPAIHEAAVRELPCDSRGKGMSNKLTEGRLLPCKKCGSTPEWVGHLDAYDCPKRHEHDYEELLNSLRRVQERAGKIWNQENWA
jgi:hypothetical protein